jgi:hypothetical protein
MFTAARSRTAVALASLLLALACGSDPLAPFQPEITNIADNFEFQATGLTGVTWSQEYVWTNSETTANVDHSSAITGGVTSLTIRDANGTQVYSAPLGPSGSVATSAGVAGSWRIAVVLTNVSGTINFRVQ